MSHLLSDRYILKEKLGEGGFSSVYKAIDTRLDREVAIKILKTQLSDSQEMVTRFLREAKLTASLKHSHSLNIYDYGHHDDELFIVSELLNGQALDELLKEQGTIKEEWLCERLIPICMALQEAHDVGVIHRDLKPSNLYLSTVGQEERLILIDFGISKVNDTKFNTTELKKVTKTGQLFGTPHYMSPEQILKPNQVDHRSDLYSLGIIMYEMVIGHPPFESESIFEVLSAHMKTVPPTINSFQVTCSLHLERLIHRLLEKEPSQRPASALEVAEVLKEILADHYFSSVEASLSMNGDLHSTSQLGQPKQSLDFIDNNEVVDESNVPDYRGVTNQILTTKNYRGKLILTVLVTMIFVTLYLHFAGERKVNEPSSSWLDSNEDKNSKSLLMIPVQPSIDISDQDMGIHLGASSSVKNTKLENSQTREQVKIQKANEERTNQAQQVIPPIKKTKARPKVTKRKQTKKRSKKAKRFSRKKEKLKTKRVKRKLSKPNPIARKSSISSSKPKKRSNLLLSNKSNSSSETKLVKQAIGRSVITEKAEKTTNKTAQDTPLEEKKKERLKKEIVQDKKVDKTSASEEIITPKSVLPSPKKNNEKPKLPPRPPIGF